MYKIVSTRINELNKEYSNLRFNSKRDRKKMKEIIVRIDELKVLVKNYPETDHALDLINSYDEAFREIQFCPCDALERFAKVYELVNKILIERFK